MGLDPDAMQSTTKSAVQATVQAAAGQVEVMVRNLADGMRDLFGIMLRLMSKNIDEEQMMRMNGAFVPVDPRVWDQSMDVSINVGLGTGREEEKAMALNQALQMQTMVYQNYGPMNGLVSLTNIRNTLADQLAVSGIRNADRYFAPMLTVTLHRLRLRLKCKCCRCSNRRKHSKVRRLIQTLRSCRQSK